MAQEEVMSDNTDSEVSESDTGTGPGIITMSSIFTSMNTELSLGGMAQEEVISYDTDSEVPSESETDTGSVCNQHKSGTSDYAIIQLVI